jgi:hypothetical protein
MSVSVKDFKKIIGLCKKSGVSRLKLADFEVEFAEKEQKHSKREVKVKDSPNREVIETESLKRAEQALKEEYIGNLLLEDPAEYERLVMQGELHEEAHDRGLEQDLQ